MSLATLQQALAQIYTDSQLREDFLTNPDVVGKSLNLNCSEIQQLSKISASEVNFYANSLKYKRLGEVRKLLPLTVKLLGKDFNRLFFSYAETYLPYGTKKHLKDAIAFTQFLLKREFEVGWHQDIISYESFHLQRLNTQKKFVFASFNHSITSSLELLENNKNSVDLAYKKYVSLGFRWTTKQKFIWLNLPMM